MNPESVQLIVTKLEELIRAANGKVEGIFPYYVKQATICGWASFIALCLSFVFFVTALALFTTKNCFTSNEIKPKGVFAIACAVLFFISITASASGTVTPFAILNPEIYAIKLLLGTFH